VIFFTGVQLVTREVGMEWDQERWWTFPVETDLQRANVGCKDDVWSDVG